MNTMLLIVFLCLQIVAAILAIAGIVMMTYADGFHSHSVIGITLVVTSASMSALYKVGLPYTEWPFHWVHLDNSMSSNVRNVSVIVFFVFIKNRLLLII